MNLKTLKILFYLLIISGKLIGQSINQDYNREADQKIFITGGMFTKPFLKYLAEQTGKSRPKICFLPTASADNPDMHAMIRPEYCS